MPGPTFNRMFESVTPSPAREVAARAILSISPTRVVMPAAGRFGATEALVKAGYPARQIYCSDIGLFSSLIGYLADPDLRLDDLQLTFRGTGLHLVEEQPPEDDVDMAALVMVVMKYDQLLTKHQYGMNLRREVLSQAQTYRAGLRSQLTTLLEGVGPIHYEIADLREPTNDETLMADEHAALFLNPPGFSATSYNKLFPGESVQWGSGKVPTEAWDEDAATALYEKLTDAPLLSVIYSINAKNVPDSWTRLLAISRPGGRVDYIISTRDVDMSQSLTLHSQTAGGQPRIFEVYADQEITPDSELEFVEIDRPTAMYYRDLFVHRLGTTQSEWYLGMLVDGRLVTVLGLNRQRFMHFLSGYVKETFGISVTSQRYKRIGSLFMEALTTTSFRDWMRLHGRYGIRKMLGIETTSLTRHEVSKIDRKMMRMVAKEQLPNGMWKLQYRADLREESFNDVLARWLETQAQHRRGQKAAETAPTKLSRADRRKLNRGVVHPVNAEYGAAENAT